MKGYNGRLFVAHDRVTVRPRSNGSHQVDACVQAPSVSAMVRLLGCSRGEVNNYWSDSLNAGMEEALSAYPPGTVLVKPMVGGAVVSVDGQTGWTPLDPTVQPHGKVSS